MTTQDEINIVHNRGTHVVLLGAGASLASTLRNPERSGKQLPLMRNIVDIVGLNDVVSCLPVSYKVLKDDFERLYSKIYSDNQFSNEKAIIEERVYNYFKGLDLPDEPTIYDYLILSLRHSKDVIATFNWDPFLYKAFCRNSTFVKSPGILFLHGSVSIGYNRNSGRSGPAGGANKQNLEYYEPTQLLYPVDRKNYTSDPFISGQWEALSNRLKEASWVTVFGYSAPVSDVEAIDLLKNAWGDVNERSMEQIEIIDKRNEQDVKKAWSKFIHSNHYNYCTDYFECSLAHHPRRTIESYNHWATPLLENELFQEGNKVPTNFKKIEELWEWFRPLIESEENNL